jgi:hypothetical protein
MPPKCEPGTIRRKAYDAVRSSTHTTYHVKSACIEDVGKPGKTPASERITVSEEGDLGKYGYSSILTIGLEKRRTALKKAIVSISKEKKMSEHDSAVKVMRRLNLLFVLNKNTNKTLSQTLERDRNWVGRTYLGVDYARE